MLNNVCLNYKFWYKIEKMGPFLVNRSKWEKVPICELHPFFEHLSIKEDLSKISQNYKGN
jgi:hypothetical protein